ncbi:DapH/DapD/GlmU-related protein [Sporofaciens sp. JLR.KK001]|uniref:DapH/DapD/GlmU-related protein n=1 Tax=Sporofaciens sp. JLR.KK001 TaxID=3112621 RepID=UPI002FF10999
MTKNEYMTYIGENVIWGENIKIGYYSYIGREGSNNSPLTIGKNVTIGSFCLLETGSVIGNNTEIDDYCAIYSGAQVGNSVKLLYGKKIYSKAEIGERCIIGGDVPERMVLDDSVTFMGEVAHSHYNPKLDWDITDEPSPRIGKGSIIGVNALLIGGIEIGKNCYISAGEILRHNLSDDHVYYKGKVYHINEFKGLIRTRYQL